MPYDEAMRPWLAAVCAIDRRSLRRFFIREGVEILGRGKLSFVSLSEIQRKLPSFFEGIQLAHRVLHGLQ